jgi:hypothetical protein
VAPRLKPDPIGVAEMKRYLETESDFDFELRVLHSLVQMGMRCEHGGHYEDPVTKKSREFDVRLRRADGGYNIFAAIECKNLRQNFPLLVSCVPRTRGEAWHQIVHVEDPPPKTIGGIPVSSGMDGRSTLHRVKGPHSQYRVGDLVGKSTAQVGLSPQNNEIVAQDSEIFDKWGQSLASLHDFGWEIEKLPHDSYAMAIPIVVVPNDRLWQAAYGSDGTRIRDPERVDHCSVYAGGAEFRLGLFEAYQVTHVEIMTYSGLLAFVRRWLEDARSLHELFMGGLAA